MDSNYHVQLVELLKDQKEIFGDDLLDTLDLSSIKKVETSSSNSNYVASNSDNKGEDLFVEDFQKAQSINELDGLINTCQKCALGKTRTKFVFGVGNPNANAMLIGEAPGADEDKQGEPFVGRAGKLLTDILKAIELTREEVFIANILKCRPPGNRDPLPSEMETCIPYLQKQIELIKPKVILCLGRVAANGLFNKKLTLAAFREGNFNYNGIPVVITYHPAALLRNPNWKRGCWEDVKVFKKTLDELTSK